MIPTLIFVLFSLVNNTSDFETVYIEVTVVNIKSMEGSIRLGVYNSSESFPLKKRQFLSIVEKVRGDTVVLNVEVQKGQEFAFAVYHDIDDDDLLDFNFLGLPAEPYGFSNNYRPVLTGLDFEDCLVDTKKDNDISIKLLDLYFTIKVLVSGLGVPLSGVMLHRSLFVRPRKCLIS